MNIVDYSNPIPSKSLRYDGKTLGLVVKNFEDIKKDNVIGVYIPRLMFGLPVASGPYEETISIDKSKLVNSINKNIGSSKLKIKNYVELIVAQSNNILPPKFAKGENVWIENCDRDIKNMYVLPYGFGESNRRKNDIWTMMVPNYSSFPTGDEEELNYDNSFGIQMDTKNKTIAIWTSYEGGKEESKKEKGIYSILINAKDGTFILNDTNKRSIEMNSSDDRISIMNEAKSEITIEKDTITQKCKTFNVEASDEINIKCSKLNRDADNIETNAKSDKEEIDKLEIKGNNLSSNYNTTKIESSSYENKTSKWKTDSPISGFTKTLTANSFSIWGNAGINPPPTCANISSSGIAKFGNPNAASTGLLVAQPTLSALMSIAAKIDTIGAVVYCPPTAVTTLSANMAMMTSKCAMG